MEPREIKDRSPSGDYSLYITPREMRMSHWVDAPSLIESATGAVIFDLSPSMWSLDRVEWMTGDDCLIEMRHYPGDHDGYVRVKIYPRAKVFRIEDTEFTEMGALSKCLEETYRKIRRK